LGHIITEEGIEVDSEKIKSIEGWPSPRNHFELRSFMGLAGYYRRFIEGISRISHPITSLQNKGVKFEWTPECERIFEHLKILLTSAPILKFFILTNILLYASMHAKKGLVGSLVRMVMWCVMN
jgi:hypothetical protein